MPQERDALTFIPSFRSLLRLVLRSFRFLDFRFAGRCSFDRIFQPRRPNALNRFTMFKSILLFSTLFALAFAAPLPDGGSAYSGAGGSANGGSVTNTQKSA